MGTRLEASPASLTCSLHSEATNIRVMLKWTGVALLVVNLGSSAGTTCPCVTTKWEYKGETYSYCNNPNGAKTSWCPTALNDDGTYTSNLPFVFCEGEVYNVCEDEKDAQEKPPCPCAPDKGGEWKYGGQSQLYCADPSSSESLSSGDVSLSMAVSNNYYVYPHNSSEFPTGPGEVDLVNNITALFNAGASCAGKPDCNGTFVNLVESP